jgi:hypothetical protein
MSVINYLSFATVLMNCLLMFWFRNQIIPKVENLIIDLQFFFPSSISYSKYRITGYLGPSYGDHILLTDKDIIDFIMVIILVEHAVIGLKVFLAEVINDEPSWVVKKMIQVNNKIEELNRIFKESEKEDVEKKLKLKVQ